MSEITATIKTNVGDLKLRLFEEKAPNTVKNFTHLASTGYYDGTIFHRVIKDFMVQGGCPDGIGTGGPDYRIADEFVSDLKHDGPGILSMANSGPDTGGSQFFVTLVPTPWLDGRHTVFGEMISGEEILINIGQVETEAGDRPVEPIMVISVEIEKEGKLLKDQEAPEKL
ncbi:peptidylprolyl isomerase [bacterium]|nr:peptidylprolyl isomerase [bacterium]